MMYDVWGLVVSFIVAGTLFGVFIWLSIGEDYG